jgi:hypothetical protein
MSRGLYCLLWKRKRGSSIGNRIFVHHRIISAVKRVALVIDTMPYIVLRGHWCNTILSNVHSTK